MIAVLGGLADVERDVIRTRTAEGPQPGAKARAADGATSGAHPGTAERGQPTPCGGRYAPRARPQLQRRHIHHSPSDTRRMSSSTLAGLARSYDLSTEHNFPTRVVMR